MMLYNSLTERVESVMPLSLSSDAANKGIACYTCGPTVYAPAHLGHARTYVLLDILRRCLEHQATLHQKRPPLFVLNITDVDDKILKEAAKRGLEKQPLALARRYEAEFWEDWDALHCLRPHVVTRVTEHVESDIVPYIQRLLDLGMAYQIGDSLSDDENGGIYFDVRAYQERMGTRTRYGKLAPPNVATDVYNRQPPHDGGEQSPEKMKKRDARDFALWKKRKGSEHMFWESPWGLGRPGWHVECSAMIEAVSRQFQNTHTFAMHAGGIDLAFPHHTNEISQAEAYHIADAELSSATEPSAEWIRHWVHTGHLHIDGKKMSKSLKNFESIKDFLSNASVANRSGATSSLNSPADDFRLWCLGLSGPYRGNAVYSKVRLEISRNVRNRIVRFLLNGEEWLLRRKEAVGAVTSEATKKWQPEDCDLFASVNEAVAKSRNALLSDLDGWTYVEQLVKISEDGRSYMANAAATGGPTEPISTALRALRDLLVLVGFSDATCRAGMPATAGISEAAGGDRALISELAKFRSAVRRAAIDDHKDMSTTPSDNMKSILKLCDEARDKVFPALGVEILDGGVAIDSGSGDPSADDWRYCLTSSSPVTPDKTATVATSILIRKAITSGNMQPVPADVLFKIGSYEGLFSDYNEDGFPVLNADGSDISNTQLKKLRKTFVKHIRHLEKRRRAKEKLNAKKGVYAKRREVRSQIRAGHQAAAQSSEASNPISTVDNAQR